MADDLKRYNSYLKLDKEVQTFSQRLLSALSDLFNPFIRSQSHGFLIKVHEGFIVLSIL